MLNLDFLSFLAAIVVVTVVLAVAWRLVRGRARTAWWATLRVAVMAFVALAVVGAASYWLMDSRTFQVAGTLVSRVDTADKVVALSFDDGPDMAHVDEIVADLRDAGARGTFFVVGAAAEKEPAALRSLVAAGEEVGNHSFTHARLVGVSVDRVAHEVEATDELLRAAGYGGPILWRPPYCKKLVSEPYYLWRHGRTTVTWDLEPDSIGSLAGDPQAMASYVADNVRPGSIILLHPWGQARAATRRALPLILQALAAKGYRCVTVAELLATR